MSDSNDNAVWQSNRASDIFFRGPVGDENNNDSSDGIVVVEDFPEERFVVGDTDLNSEMIDIGTQTLDLPNEVVSLDCRIAENGARPVNFRVKIFLSLTTLTLLTAIVIVFFNKTRIQKNLQISTSAPASSVFEQVGKFVKEILGKVIETATPTPTPGPCDRLFGDALDACNAENGL
ncbi:MAG: hypothetical protein K2L13_00205 [Opitutales bacterium]|nr:hypothetical protein [Opitutales bacterium]